MNYTIKNTTYFGDFKIGCKIKAMPITDSKYNFTNYSRQYIGTVVDLYMMGNELTLRTQDNFEVNAKYFEVINDES